MRAIFPHGLLIALEGIDGCGKSSIATALAQYCGEHGVLCALSKEPTSVGPGAELRRAQATGRLTAEEEYRSFLADRQAQRRLPGDSRDRPAPDFGRERTVRPAT